MFAFKRGKSCDNLEISCEGKLGTMKLNVQFNRLTEIRSRINKIALERLGIAWAGARARSFNGV